MVEVDDFYPVAADVATAAAATTVVDVSLTAANAVEGAVAVGILLVIVLPPGRLNALAASFILSAWPLVNESMHES